MPPPEAMISPLTRRSFLRSSGATAAGLCVQSAVFAAQIPVPRSQLAQDTLRPQFHLLPAAGWMNDPNGPIFAHGRYHMFCQHNPKGAVWGNMSWAHMVSTDMVHWRHLPVALRPDPGTIDAYGIFSGSCFQVGQRVCAVYTATEISDAADATTHGQPDIRESQRLAYSDDPYLQRWTKEPTAIVPRPPSELKQVTGFRDPSIWQQDGAFYMTVGSGETGVGGCVLLYRSAELKQWTYLHKLAASDWHGKVGDDKVASGEMWECPDFFALDGGHVLIYSTEGKVFWQSGVLDTGEMRFHPSRSGVLDLGAYYAPKTQLDASGNRILWGWIPERRPSRESEEAGWAGVMSLPRVLHLDANGLLRMETLAAFKMLRQSAIPVRAAGTASSFTLPASNGEAVVMGSPGRDLSLVAKELATGKVLAQVKFDSARSTYEVDDKQFEVELKAVPELHLFLDGSVLELILGERVGYTKRFYLPDAPSVEILVVGGRSLKAWPVRPISSDRLTTPGGNAR